MSKSGESKYRLLVEGVTDYAIYFLETDGRITSWNAGAERFHGFSSEEAIGRNFGDFYTEEERAKAMSAGAVAFLSKPFTEDELLNALAQSQLGSTENDVAEN